MGLVMDVCNGGQAVDISVLNELAKRRDMQFQQSAREQQHRQRQQEQAQTKTRTRMSTHFAEKLATKTSPFPLFI